MPLTDKALEALSPEARAKIESGEWPTAWSPRADHPPAGSIQDLRDNMANAASTCCAAALLRLAAHIKDRRLLDIVQIASTAIQRHGLPADPRHIVFNAHCVLPDGSFVHSDERAAPGILSFHHVVDEPIADVILDLEPRPVLVGTFPGSAAPHDPNRDGD